MIPYSMNPLGINNELSDLDILRQIRNANPTSQLPSLWLDSEDPYTQWEGVTYGNFSGINKVIILSISSKNITLLPNINKLTQLQNLYCQNNNIASLYLKDVINLKYLWAFNNQLSELNIQNNNNIIDMYCSKNKLISIPTLITKGGIINYDFRYNNFPTSELDRFRALGFTGEGQLLPQNI